MDLAALTSTTAQSASANASSQLTQNFDTFLTLLTTQLRNQDPLAPLDTEKFTEQLVQFASVEQSIQTNQHLEALIALQTSSDNETALAMAGRIATVQSDIATLTNDPARWKYELPVDAETVSIQVLDASGAVVAQLNGDNSAGLHEIEWAGDTNNGAGAPQGAYRLNIAAIDADGNSIDANISTRGRVDAVAFENGATEIEIAGQRFALDLVSRVDLNF